MLLLLCKNCSTVLYEIKNDMYKQSNFTSKRNLTIVYSYDYYCKLCHKIIGLGSLKICKECLIKQNVSDDKNYVCFYDWSPILYATPCIYCRKKISPFTILNKNTYELKII